MRSSKRYSKRDVSRLLGMARDGIACSRFRGAARYDQFRRFKEVDPDLTFRRYLTEYAGKEGNP